MIPLSVENGRLKRADEITYYDYPAWDATADFEKYSRALAAHQGRWRAQTSLQLSEFGSLSNTNEWYGAITAPNNGKVYFLPLTRPEVLVLDPTDDSTTTIAHGETDSFKWHGGALSSNGCIYCVPRDNDKVLKIDPTDDTASTFGTLSGSVKWNGAVPDPTGDYIYGIPRNSTTILKIDTTDDSTSTFGSFSGSNKWNGGALAPNGKIYCVPAVASTVLVIDTSDDSTEEIGSGLGSTGSYHGAVCAHNGMIYGVGDTEGQMIKIDPETHEVTEFGSIESYRGIVAHPNGLLYGVPSDSDYVLVFDPVTEEINEIAMGATTQKKFNGGTLAPNGCIYCAPNNLGQVGKILAEFDEEVPANMYASVFRGY